MNAEDLKRNAQYLIEQIRAEGAGDDDESVKNALHDGELLAELFCLDEYDPEDADSVAQHAEAQAIAEEAYSLL